MFWSNVAKRDVRSRCEKDRSMVLFECELELEESDQPIQSSSGFGREAVPGDGVTASVQHSIR